MRRLVAAASFAAGLLCAQPETFTNSIEMEFVLVKAGEFQMGCSVLDDECRGDEKPVHSVRISKPFYISKYETTQEQWKRIMGGNPAYFGENRTGSAWPKHPIEQVSWNAVQEFLEKLTANEKDQGRKYRLPTEAEWEYAARAGSKSAYQDAARERAGWSWMNSGGTTHPVGELKPNPWGIYDMLGNVWEWVQDVYDSKYYRKSPAADPPGAQSDGDRAIRGSSWYWNVKNMRVSWRYRYGSDYFDYAGGFRPVVEVQ